MVKVIYGKKGTGKTKSLIDTANNLAVSSTGNVVFLDYSNQLVIKLSHEIRFINVSEFPISGDSAFFGFLCGVISENYDIDSIFIDGLTYIVKQEAPTLEGLLKNIGKVAEKYNIKFYISINGESESIPEFIKEYTV